MPHETQIDMYGPGTFTDTRFIPLPEDCRRLLKHLVDVTPGFTSAQDFLNEVKFQGADLPIIPGPLKSQAMSAVIHAMIGLAAKEVCALKGIDAGQVIIDVDKSGLYPATPLLVSVEGKSMKEHGDLIYKRGLDLDRRVLSKTPMSYRSWAIYPTKDPKVWYQFLSTFDPPGYLKTFGMNADEEVASRKEAYDIIRKGVQQYTAAELDLTCMEHGYCGQTCYTPAQWRKTNMAKSLARHPLINYEQVKGTSDLPPVPLPQRDDQRPLAGIRVVELARVIAAPALGAALTALGAEVIKVQSPSLHDLQSLNVQLTADKTTYPLDLNLEADRQKLHSLIEGADVVVQAFRLRSLAKKGFGLEDVLEIARKRGKGIVYVDLNCYGPDGYYAERPGFQQIADAASGCCYVCGKAYGFEEGVGVLPSLPIADMLSGAVGVVDVLLALRDRAKHGGSYHAFVALTAVDDIQLSPEVGLLPQETVKAIQEKYQFAPMTPDLHVSELLEVVVNGWKKNSDLLTRPGYMTGFAETPFGRDHEILSPIVRFGNNQVTPRWLRGPVPYCWNESAEWQRG